MAKREYHIQRTPIPEGFQIYEEWLEVAGIHHRKAAAITFINGRDPWLEFELEPSNVHDQNAIKVIGCTKGLLGVERGDLGYVPAELAARIARAGLRDRVRPRLWKTYLSDSGFVVVGFQLLGPAGHEGRAAFDTSGRHTTRTAGAMQPSAPAGQVLYQFEWTNSGRLRLEVSHPALGKRRVITGDNRSILEDLARKQVEDWEKAAADKERARQKQLERAQGAEAAAQRTQEAQAAIAEAESILSHTLAIDDAIDWAQLKDHTTFAKAEPVLPNIPREPQLGDDAYRARRGLLGLVSQSVREQREATARTRFENDHDAWAANRDAILSQHHRRALEWHEERRAFLADQEAHNEVIEEHRQRYLSHDPPAVVEYCNLVLGKSVYPDWLSPSFELDYLAEPKTLVADYQLPGPEAMPRIKEVRYVASRGELKETYLNDAQVRQMYDAVVYQITLRTVHELLEADKTGALAAVAFNGWVRFTDKGTGQEGTACILSLHVSKEQFLALNLAKIEPKQCFKSLKGVGSPRMHSLTPVAPIIEISHEDRRFVQSYGVADQLDEGYNLAAMDWKDFEHLVRELFEQEFGQSGGEVKVTQASRDGGVDAVAFDPDPIRGGKIVIQAKRYTSTVGVSAVRDLYGTVMNEGATKGILVTTSDFGPDAHDFAKGKPLTLLSGANLLHLLAKHGHKAHIDLAAARRLERPED